MKNYNIKGKEIKPHNILFSITSERDYEMDRVILLEGMPECSYDEYVLLEGYHCSCYDFDECKWDGTVYTREELNTILSNEQYGSRKKLKEFWNNY